MRVSSSLLLGNWSRGDEMFSFIHTVKWHTYIYMYQTQWCVYIYSTVWLCKIKAHTALSICTDQNVDFLRAYSWHNGDCNMTMCKCILDIIQRVIATKNILMYNYVFTLISDHRHQQVTLEKVISHVCGPFHINSYEFS